MSVIRVLGTLAGLVLVGKLLEENRRLRFALDERTALNAALADEVLLHLWTERAKHRQEMWTKPAGWDEVDEAGDESFPASDPPAFAGR